MSHGSDRPRGPGDQGDQSGKRPGDEIRRLGDRPGDEVRRFRLGDARRWVVDQPGNVRRLGGDKGERGPDQETFRSKVILQFPEGDIEKARLIAPSASDLARDADSKAGKKTVRDWLSAVGDRSTALVEQRPRLREMKGGIERMIREIYQSREERGIDSSKPVQPGDLNQVQLLARTSSPEVQHVFNNYTVELKLAAPHSIPRSSFSEPNKWVFEIDPRSTVEEAVLGVVRSAFTVAAQDRLLTVLKREISVKDHEQRLEARERQLRESEPPLRPLVGLLKVTLRIRSGEIEVRRHVVDLRRKAVEKHERDLRKSELEVDPHELTIEGREQVLELREQAIEYREQAIELRQQALGHREQALELRRQIVDIDELALGAREQATKHLRQVLKEDPAKILNGVLDERLEVMCQIFDVNRRMGDQGVPVRFNFQETVYRSAYDEAIAQAENAGDITPETPQEEKEKIGHKAGKEALKSLIEKGVHITVRPDLSYLQARRMADLNIKPFEKPGDLKFVQWKKDVIAKARLEGTNVVGVDVDLIWVLTANNKFLVLTPWVRVKPQNGEEYVESIKHYQLALLDPEAGERRGQVKAAGAMKLRIDPTSSSPEEGPRIQLLEFNSGSGHFMTPSGETLSIGLDAAIAAGWVKNEDLDSARIRVPFPKWARMERPPR
jgi:tetratricopeptide (TPR) repeat protein